MSGVRSLLKSLVERSLVALGAPKILRVAANDDGVVLAYHNVVPEGGAPGGDRSLHLPRSDFARQLDVLSETHAVVDLESVIRGGQRDRPRPLAAVTFDDGYRGALTVGLDELAARGLPCTVFVPPGLLGTDDLWWDALAPGDGRGLPDAFREEALTRARGRSDDVLRWAEREGLARRPQPEHAGLVDETELTDAARRESVTLGAHGWTHANLTRLDGAELRAELGRPLEWLEERFPGSLVRWLSLPYGRGDDRVVSAAVEAGYRGVLDLSGGLVDREHLSEARRLPRQNVPAGVSLEGFRLRASGMEALWSR